MRIHTDRSFLALLTIASLAAAAVAQPPTKDAQPPALGGPTVTDPGPAPGASPTLDGGQRGDRKDKPQLIPHRVFMKALHDALDHPDDMSLALSSEQSTKIDAANKAYENAQAAYMRDHRDQLEELRKNGLSRAAITEARGKGGANKGNLKAKGASSADTTPEQRQALLQRAKELRDGAPKPDDTRAAIWAVLTQPQKDAVEAKLQAFRDKLGEKYVERRGKGGKGRKSENAVSPAPAAPVK